MILALDSSTAACTAALFDDDGALLASRDEVIGRGHAERLVPMIDELLQGRRPTSILVGTGPGSFTGLRVALAAAHGMAIGWNVPVQGLPTLALLAASEPGDEPIIAALAGGHGELFVQSFERAPWLERSPALNLAPAEAAQRFGERMAVGSGAQALVDARGGGEALDLLPSARHACRVPRIWRTAATPLYVRAPDARPRAA